MATYLQLENGKELLVRDGSAFPVVKRVISMQDIDNRSGSISKTITIEGTKENVLILGALFDVNIVNADFNINKKIRCDVIQDGVNVFERCFFQLRKVVKKGTNTDNVYFEGIVYNDVTDFFKEISNKFLRDLNFGGKGSLNYELVTGSWENTFEDVIVFPNMLNESNNYEVTDFKPAVFYRAIWDAIFESAGFTYTWDSIDDHSINFSSLISPTVDRYEPSPLQVQLNTVDIGTPLIQNPDDSPIIDGVQALDFTNLSMNAFLGQNTQLQQFSSEIELTNVNNNPNLQYDNTTYTFTAFNTGKYTFEFDIDVDFNLVSSANTNLVNANNSLNELLYYEILPFIIRPAFQTQIYIGSGSPLVFQLGDALSSGDNFFNRKYKGIISVDLVAGNTFIFSYAGRRRKQFADAIGQGLIWDNATVQFKANINSLNVQIIPEINYEQGLTILPNEFLPKKVKQSDFVKSVFNVFNLIPITDKEDERNIIIMRRDDYYNAGTQRDYSKQLAKDKDFVVQFLPNVNSKAIELSYTDDKDEVNTAYKNQTKETFGQLRYIFENENTKGIDRRELVFSPTPIIRTNYNAFIPTIPTEISEDLNMRMLYWLGEKPCNNYTIENNVLTKYGAAHHCNDALNPSFDLNFGVARYYLYGGFQKTFNNLFNLHYRRLFEQLNNGKRAIGYFNLSEADKNALELNDLIYINNSWWNIEEISYNANGKDLTKLVLFNADDIISINPIQTPSSDDPVNYTDNVSTTKSDTPVFIFPTLDIIDRIKRIKNAIGSLNFGILNGVRNFVGAGSTNYMINGNDNIVNASNVLISGNNQVANEPGAYFDKLFVNGQEVKPAVLTTIINTNNSDITVDADTFDILLWAADFTANRTLQIDNFTPSILKRVLIVNNNTVSRDFNLKVRNGISGGYSDVLFVNNGTDPVTTVNIDATTSNGGRWLEITSFDTNNDNASDLFIGKFN